MPTLVLDELKKARDWAFYGYGDAYSGCALGFLGTLVDLQEIFWLP